MRTAVKQLRKAGGHVLIMTLVVAGVLGIAIAAYLNVIHAHNNMTVRSQVWNSCMPLVEAGIEEAFAHINNAATTNWASNGWTRDATGTNFVKSRTIGSGTFTCTMSTNSDPNPVITCTGSLPAPVTVGSGKNAFLAVGGTSPQTTILISRTVQVKTTKPPALLKGLMAKTSIDFSGNTCGTDSYNSSNGLYNVVGLSGLLNRGANGDVACNGDLVNVGTANINGHLAVGPYAKVKIGGQGFVGDLVWTLTHTGIEKNWVRYDMNVDLADVRPPWTAGTAGVPSSSGSAKYTLDSANYEMDSLTIAAGDLVIVTNGISTLWVKGNVDIQGNINVSQPGGLRLYVGGTVNLSGTWSKSSLPSDLIIYGLPSCTSVGVKTGSKLEAVIYAPEAALTLNGTANLFGSATAASIKLTGSSMFHYDEALGSMAPSIYTLVSWKEL